MRPQDDFGHALSKLQGSMDNLATSTIRARNREFPPVEITTDRKPENLHPPEGYHLFCTDKSIRDAEFSRRKRESVSSWYFDLASNNQPMREITAEETQALYRQVEQDFVRELNEYLYQYPETEYKK